MTSHDFGKLTSMSENLTFKTIAKMLKYGNGLTCQNAKSQLFFSLNVTAREKGLLLTIN